MRVITPAESALAGAAAGASQPEPPPRRRRLWELDPSARAAIIGLCLPPAALRRIAAQAAAGAPVDDLELHRQVLDECSARTPLAEALHKALDRRHALALRRAGRATSQALLAAWWHDAAARGDVAGASWAVLTHPHATPALGQRVLAELQALPRPTNSTSAASPARLDALVRENQILARQLGAAQQRSAQIAAEQARAAQAAEAALVRVRAEVLRRDIETVQLRERVAALEAAASAGTPRARASRQRREQADRIDELQRALAQAQAQCEQQRLRNAELADELLAVRRTVTVAPAVRAGLASAALRDRSVLCVSARSASVPVYRQLVERTGGRFVHHDDADDSADGRELDARLEASDLVICQTGCLSHDAYWRVKTHCKRTGKRCVFVETPSPGALERALGEVAAPPPVPASEEIAAVATAAAQAAGEAAAR